MRVAHIIWVNQCNSLWMTEVWSNKQTYKHCGWRKFDLTNKLLVSSLQLRIHAFSRGSVASGWMYPLFILTHSSRRCEVDGFEFVDHHRCELNFIFLFMLLHGLECMWVCRYYWDHGPILVVELSGVGEWGCGIELCIIPSSFVRASQGSWRLYLSVFQTKKNLIYKISITHKSI